MSKRLGALSFRQLWALNKFSYAVRVFIALTGAMAVSWGTGHVAMVIPLFLGVIASALAETEDSWQGRSVSVVITLISFAITAAVVQLLMPYGVAFFITLVVTTFFLEMCGALGKRYAAIAKATLILAVYTMIGLNQAQQSGHELPLWYEPVLLTAGALWYGLLSILWCALFSHLPLKQALADLYGEVGVYLKIKSRLFQPDEGLEVDSSRLALAQQHVKVVAALNQVRQILVSHINSEPRSARLGRFIKLYFIAQGVHERASSSHYRYSDLAEMFFHSDILFRLQRQLREQARNCRLVGDAIRLGQPISLPDTESALSSVQRSLAHLAANRPAQPSTDEIRLYKSLLQLSNNIMTIESDIARSALIEDEVLPDASKQIPEPKATFRSLLGRIREQLTPRSVVFRHAVRMTLAMASAYLLINALDLRLGYWVLLTILFVCFPSFGSTRTRLYERIAGTVLGLVIAWALLTLFQDALIQSIFAVIAGVVFFLYRTNRYVIATGAITLMVICCFNQVVNGYGVIWPRLIDTLLGAGLSALVVSFVLPDWHYRQLHITLADALRRYAAYLDELMRLYRESGVDEQAYLRTRRSAYNADATLASTLASMLLEPGHFRRDAALWQRMVIRCHTLVNYIAAFAAHRGALETHPHNVIINQAGTEIVAGLNEMANALESRKPVPSAPQSRIELKTQLDELPDDMDDQHRFVQTQLQMLLTQLDHTQELAQQLQQLQQHAASSAKAATKTDQSH